MNSKTNKETTLEAWFDALIGRLEQQGKYATSRNYRKTLESLQMFTKTDNIHLSYITEMVVAEYEDFLIGRGVCRNSRSFYIRVLRAACNKAAKDGYQSPENGVFDRFFTGVDETRKRALNMVTLKRIANLDLSDDWEMDLSRDLFLFSFYARGMCFVDMARLSKDNIKNGILSYIRSKTGQSLSLRVEPCMERIIRKWARKTRGKMLFPILDQTGTKASYEQYQYRLCRHNLMLKEIGRRVEAPFPLSSYAARHSWATTARDLNIPLSVISSGMGHSSERTTRVYLAQLDNNKIDMANRRVINMLLG